VARTFQNVALAGLAVEAFMQLFGWHETSVDTTSSTKVALKSKITASLSC